jgi:AmiR/NasT family two-component response regulator
LLGGPDTDAAWRRMAARLQPALADRTAIGQAQGVLAATRNISLEDAYAVLVERSRIEQEPLVAAARRVLSRLNNDADASSV